MRHKHVAGIVEGLAVFVAVIIIAPASTGVSASILKRSSSAAGSAGPGLPPSLSDEEFWRLTGGLSEPDGSFGSDNLLSNEMHFASIVPGVVARTKTGGVYIGVGPEQNFTYIAAMKPRIAFITDIRRGNLHLQLMYKALFELSADRAEFVSRLFTKPRPVGLTSSSSATELMNALWDTHSADETAYAANLLALQNHLTRTHSLPLSPDDLDGIARVYRAFYWYGPRINYLANTSLTPPPSNMDGTLLALAGGPSYRDLMIQSDVAGHELSYLASEEKFAYLQGLERRNLIVPVVGDLSGPKALRAVGAYVRGHGATVSAFYVSNVEAYLRMHKSWPAFCANVATLPLNAASLFIRFVSGPGVYMTRNPDGTVRASYGGDSSGPVARLVPMAAEVRACPAAGPSRPQPLPCARAR